MSNNYSQDIPYTKQSDIQEYISVFDVNNEIIDFTTLNTYQNSDYVFNTNALQKVKNNIDVMQSNFNNDIISNLDDKQELFQSWVSNLSANVKPWQSGVENKYYKGDVVTYDQDEGAIFLCLKDCDGSSSLESSFWLRIYPKGKAGLDAFQFNWRGEWQSGETYTVGAAIPPKFIPPSLVWYQVGSVINFYACIQNVTSDIPPDQDTTHWVKLFTQKLDGFVVLDSMPNQAWFDDDTNPSVFGVKQSDSITIKVIDRVHSESASNPQYLKLYTVANNVVDNNDNNLNTLINNLISNANI